MAHPSGGPATSTTPRDANITLGGLDRHSHEVGSLRVEGSGQHLLMATLDDLEGTSWPDPGPEATSLARRCHELRGKDLDDFAVEDLRILIGQAVSLRWLVPQAILVVETNPYSGGDLYPGDLLSALFNVPESYWATDTESWLRLRALAEQLVTIGDRSRAFVDESRGGA